MKEISNSTLTVFIVMSIVVSVFGTYMSVNRLTDLDYAKATEYTGFAISDQGRANVTVSAAVALILLDETIDLGVMKQNTTNTSESVVTPAGGDYWLVENTGGVNIDIQLYGTQSSAGTYKAMSGIGPFSTTTSDTTGGCINGTEGPFTCFMVRCNSTASGSCAVADYIPMPNASGVDFVTNLAYSGSDYASFGVNITVPIDEPSGLKSQDVTFLATTT